MKWTNKGHQFDALGEHLKNKELIIYGAGARGTAFLKEMRRMGLDGKIKGFVDRNASKICECEGLPVYDISEVLPQKKENYTIVVSIGNPKERQALSDRLVRAGYVGGVGLFLLG